MKIVLVHYRYFMSSGAEAFLFKCKALLEAHGHTVVPFSTVNSQNLPTPYAKDFCKGRGTDDAVLYSQMKKTPRNLWRMTTGAFFNFDSERCLRRVLRREKPDVMLVLQQMNALSPSVFRAAKKEGVPVLHRLSDFNLFCPRYDCLRDNKPCTECIHGDYRPAIRYRCVKGSLPATLIRSESMRFHKALHLFDNIACYITPTAHTAKLLAESGVAKEKIAVLPTFIDASAYQPRYDNDGYFLFLGRLSPEKGVDDILRAMALCPTARLKLTGKAEPAYEAHVKRLIDELGIGDRIEPTGFVQGEALQRLVQGARAMLLPAVWYENLPNAILEAFAYGKPVITSDLGSLPDAVQHERNGLLCCPHDPASLAECMRRLEESPALTQRLGMQARRDCEAKYAPEAYYEKLIALFRKAAGQ